MTKNIVVTGGAGFIGSHTVDRLIEAGHRVVVLDDFSTGKRANLAGSARSDRLHVIECDVAHGVFAALAAFTARHGSIERIVHLAAQVSVVSSIANPLADMTINYGGTLHVLEYARATGVRKVVFASSAAVYGDATDMPIGEDTLTRPMSPYGIDKLASEHALDYYASVHGISTTALRFFNVFGPRQDPSSPYSGVISIFCDRARSGQPLTIFGDGSASRDFVYVGDVARAIVAALGDDQTHDRCAIVNVGTGSAITVLQLARAIVDLGGTQCAIEHAPARAGEIHDSLARVDRLRDQLGVVAETKLFDGLRSIMT